jgi:hypothetical protein
VVGIARDRQAERYRVYEASKEKRDVMKRLRAMKESADRELAELTKNAPALLYGTPEARTRDFERCRATAADVAARIAEVEAELGKLDARHAALNADCTQAGGVAEAVMAFVDRDEQVLRDELDWAVAGANAPRVLPGGV